MSKYTLTNYYKSIKHIDLEKEQEIEVVPIKYKKGDKLRILGIPYATAKYNYYEVSYEYIKYYGVEKYLTYVEIVDYLRDRFFIRKDDEGVLHIYIKSHIIIDGDIRYFNEEKEAIDFFSTLKSRCVDAGNRLLKSL